MNEEAPQHLPELLDVEAVRWWDPYGLESHGPKIVKDKP